MGLTLSYKKNKRVISCRPKDKKDPWNRVTTKAIIVIRSGLADRTRTRWMCTAVALIGQTNNAIGGGSSCSAVPKRCLDLDLDTDGELQASYTIPRQPKSESNIPFSRQLIEFVDNRHMTHDTRIRIKSLIPISDFPTHHHPSCLLII